ncbi:hypothetical protein A1OE_137 [Candidatus Endolissoclinum faulkneri L2]|uniref:Uncharacterized protein n=1 Tax=Candidatus Endolissoclinum faulkneri L2 TaxID=1193729 RepID=K7ZC66_9PROT|nr:hypothetical protein A1OE_137 [Candidatus Endolissoclinum faulkneri L2]
MWLNFIVYGIFTAHLTDIISNFFDNISEVSRFNADVNNFANRK